MKKKEAKKHLEELIGASLWKHEVTDASDYADDFNELMDWINGVDDQFYPEGSLFDEDVEDIDADIDECKVYYYGTDSKDRDYLPFIIIYNKQVVAYGYTSD